MDVCNLTRSQRLLRDGRVKRGTFNEMQRNAVISDGKPSLPPPFPPIRLRRAEQEDIFKSSNNNNTNTKSPRSQTRSEEIGFGSFGFNFKEDYLLTKHPLAEEWREHSRLSEADDKLKEMEISFRQVFLDAAAEIALSLEAKAVESIGGANALYTVATEKGIVLPYSWFSDAADSIFDCIDHVHSSAKSAGSEGSSVPTTTGDDAAERTRVAAATALLWRMLAQVKDVVSGMGTALDLFEEIVLPCVYENIATVRSETPPLTSLSDQIRTLGNTRIATFVSAELKAVRERNASLERENRYLRKVIENWGFQIWRSATKASKRKAIALDRLSILAARSPNESLKRSVFSSWRLYTNRQKVSHVAERCANDFHSFMESSSHELSANSTVRKLAAAVLSTERTEGSTPLEPAKPKLPAPASVRPSGLGSMEPHPTHSISRSFDDPVSTVSVVCEAMLAKIKQLDAIGDALRGQSAHQVNTINRLDRQMKEANEKIEHLTSQLLDLNNQKLALVNLLHEKELESVEMERTHRRLASKNKLQLHAPWRQSAIRLIAGVCSIVLPASRQERKSERFLCRDVYEEESLEPTLEDVGMLPTREEVTFGRLAPLVVSRPYELPDPALILIDWANACLDQLHDLDGLGDAGPYAARLSDVADLCVGTVLSRLLYFLSLPLYRPTGEIKNLPEDFKANRVRLLTGRDISCFPPNPSFASSFGDIVKLPTCTRVSALLEFAADLISGRNSAHAQFDKNKTFRFADERQNDTESGGAVSTAAEIAARSYIRRRSARHNEPEDVSESESTIPSLPDLREIVSSIMVSNGCRQSSMTLLAILYLRFAHPFCHKSNVQQEEEEKIVKELAEEALNSRQQMERVMMEHKKALAAALDPNLSDKAITVESGESVSQSPFRDVLLAFTTEEKTPWQIFFERCRPLVTGSANGFLIKGNFWDLSSIENSEVFDIFSRMLMAMRISLDHHRWHIMSTCLFSGPSSALGGAKSVFRGPFGSSVTFLQHSISQCKPQPFPAKNTRLLLERRALNSVLLFRGDVSLPSYAVNPYNPRCALLNASDYAVLSDHSNTVTQHLCRYSHEWCDLFLSRCTAMSQGSVGPITHPKGDSNNVVWTLPTWRVFWREMGVTLDLIDEELLTDLFQISTASCRESEQPYDELPQEQLGDIDEEASIPIELLPTYDWGQYTAVALRKGALPQDVRHRGDVDMVFYSENGLALPLVSSELEGVLKATQELSFFEWVEAVVRTISIIVTAQRHILSGGVVGDGFLSEIYAFAKAQSTALCDDGADLITLSKVVEWFTFSKIIGPFTTPWESSPISRVRLRGMMQGAYVEEVLRFHHSALLVIFEYYGKYRGPTARDAASSSIDAYCVTIEFADWYAMLREAGAVGNDVNHATLLEIFLAASIEMRSHTNVPSVSKTLQPRPPYPVGDPRRLTPAAAAASAAAIPKTTLLPFSHFGFSMALLASIKFPSPLRPIHMRLHTYLLKHIETPLRAKIPALNTVLSQRRGQDEMGFGVLK